MGKNPAYQHYPADWARDLDDHDLEIEGAWIRICGRLWWSGERGKLTKPLSNWAKIFRKTNKKTLKILQYLIDSNIASGSHLDNQKITIISRRMVEDERIRQIRQRVGRLGGNPSLLNKPNILDNQHPNQNSTKAPTKKGGLLLQSSSSSSASYSKDFNNIWSIYPNQKNKIKAYRKYTACLKDGIPYERLLQCVKNYVLACNGKDKQHILHPATFFGPDKCYEDYVDYIPEKQKKNPATTLGKANLKEETEIEMTLDEYTAKMRLELGDDKWEPPKELTEIVDEAGKIRGIL